MLSLEQCMDIKLLHKEGHSIRQIARLTGNSRNTVRRMLRGARPPQFQTPECWETWETGTGTATGMIKDSK